MRQCIGFLLNENEYIIPILKVQEIIKIPQITKMPGVPYYVEGITNLRGRVIPVVNLKRLLSLPEETEGNKVIVISSGKITFGALVDNITGVVNIDESTIEQADEFMQQSQSQIEGVARLNDRLLILLDIKKLIPTEDQSIFEEEIVNVIEEGDKVEVVKKVSTMAGEVTVSEVIDPVKFYEGKGIPKDDPKYILLKEITNFMNAVSSGDYENADKIMNSIIQKSQSDLFKEVGKVARKLHDSLKSFREVLDPKLREIAVEHMPRAVDQLQMVIDKTEEAANKTMEIVEKYILKMDDLANHIREIQGPESSVQFLREFKNSLEDDLTEILTTQSFQDLTGQVLKKVIALVGDLEVELVRLITTFGLKFEEKEPVKKEVEKVSQEDVDELLKEFGF
ncbi:MAG: protein phosphatase CheZ [Thermodesulfovibrio sp.]|uniref:protein phosphatase CheZ n=1 Tax=unclassified Thermodesulfovibrio TaxID=2645936 RepID=UPI00083B0CFC|nr:MULTISPECIES: protein phosphatase CheZ [unclassified Thermodesulfovibrio]MDI1471799.1 protein phosphatase CheZ [Thermodesulfovibrio sp. 1176]MDI6713689.1 protein phosphatase CheZ [Thermodesulfovibrio sp.]ODA44189.1 Chemotaxis response - phosphatase CheZ [Thermodesulfovibrio sp. N1]